MHADQAWIITAAVLTLTGVIGWAYDRYVLVWSWWPWIGPDWRAERKRYVLPAWTGPDSPQTPVPVDDDPDDDDDDDWADELHVINLAVHRDRPIAQLTHYEIEAVIKDLGRADWLPERWQAAA